jgi:glyoxylase-like metal-dependent hydrolase (beta-lactamase superfamily II)
VIRRLQEDLIQIRDRYVSFHLLLNADGSAVLIDSGFLHGIRRLEAALEEGGRDWSNLTAILLTHGHLDHTYNVEAIRQRAPHLKVWGHAADTAHFRGTYPYRGIARFCGWLEEAGRRLFGYTPVTLDHTFADGDVLPFWDGLTVLRLPGHTAGHCGFYSRKHDLLFSGDLFATWRVRTILPWRILNSCPEHFPESLRRVRALKPRGILSNHADRVDAATQRARFFATFKAHSAS